MSERLAPVPLHRVAGVDRRARRRLTAIVVLVASLVAVALLKPWSTDPGLSGTALGPGGAAVAPGNAGGSTSPPATATAPATPDPTAVGDAMPCQPTEGWRFVTLEAGRLGYVRSWTVITPGPTTQPLTLRTEGLEALGFCPPGDAAAAGGSPIRAASWRGDDASGTALAVPLTLTPLARPAGLDGPWAVLYPAPPSGVIPAPPASAAPGGTPSWPSGEYSFQVDQPDGTAATFTVDVRVVP
ncbi:MAG TPA: hypothetical protein VN771_01450 [Candidatus Baltobacteraceae bacterium]|nr:hypothetical protein [Candidatus Baltobacteraceae bacterium]